MAIKFQLKNEAENKLFWHFLLSNGLRSGISSTSEFFTAATEYVNSGGLSISEKQNLFWEGHTFTIDGKMYFYNGYDIERVQDGQSLAFGLNANYFIINGHRFEWSDVAIPVQ